jgi:predicted transposase YdaD
MTGLGESIRLKAEEKGRIAGRDEGRLEGRLEGELITLMQFVNDGLITLETAAERAGLTVDEFSKQASILLP